MSVHRPSPASLFRRFRKSAVPDGGWTFENTQDPRVVAPLLADIRAVQLSAKLRSMTALPTLLNTELSALLQRVVDVALNAYRRIYGVPQDSVSIRADIHELIWAQSIEQVFDAYESELILKLQPIYQSVSDDIYGKVFSLLTTVPMKGVGAADTTVKSLNDLKRRVGEMARRTVGILGTVKEKLRQLVAKAIAAGKSMLGVAGDIAASEDELFRNRTITIARTESTEAADIAAGEAMSASGVVSHLRVTGCQFVESRGPLFASFPTCNLVNIPVGQRKEIVFHPNHTGYFVPAAFFRRDGTPVNLPLYNEGGVRR